MGQDFQQIGQSCCVPANASQPKRSGSSGVGIGPEGLPAGVIAVAVQPLFRHIHPSPYCLNLAQDVGKIAAAEAGFVQGAEGLGHINAVQPHLIRVYRLVPEVSLRRPRLKIQLSAQNFSGFPVFFLSRLFVQGEQRPSLVDVVQTALLRGICADAPVLPDEAVYKALCKGKISLVSGDLGHRQQGRQHTAVNIVPVGFFSLPDALHVPHGTLRRGFLNQPLNIGVNLFVHTSAPVTIGPCSIMKSAGGEFPAVVHNQFFPLLAFQRTVLHTHPPNIVQIKSQTAALSGEVLHNGDARFRVGGERYMDAFKSDFFNGRFRKAVDIAGGDLRAGDSGSKTCPCGAFCHPLAVSPATIHIRSPGPDRSSCTRD